MIVEAWRNAAIFGLVGLVVAAAGNARRGRAFYPLVVLAGVAGAYWLEIVDRAWALRSLTQDAPWIAVAALALWTAQGEAAWLRTRSWLGVVVLTALFGDVLVAAGLAAAEPDPARRARLVVAASGASLIGWTSGASALMLGPGGWEVALLGLALAAIGFAPGGAHRAETARPAPGRVALALVVPLCGGLFAWLMDVSGVTEIVAQGLEQLPNVLPRLHRLAVVAPSLVGGAIADEGLVALTARQILERGLSLRGDWAADAMRVGLAVGGGLPLLVVTGSRLRTGLPLWAAQAAIVLLWAWLR